MHFGNSSFWHSFQCEKVSNLKDAANSVKLKPNFCYVFLLYSSSDILQPLFVWRKHHSKILFQSSQICRSTYWHICEWTLFAPSLTICPMTNFLDQIMTVYTSATNCKFVTVLYRSNWLFNWECKLPYNFVAWIEGCIMNH